MPTINSFLRFLHASPGTPAVDIYIDENPVLKNISYNEISKYLVLDPKTIHIQVFHAGEVSNPLLDTELDIPASETITAALIGTLPDISLFPIFLNVAVRDNDDALIRFTNLSPAIPAAHLLIEDEMIRFSEVEYMQVTEYEIIAPGTYTLQLRMANEDDSVLAYGTIAVKPRTAFTIYAIGLLDEDPSLALGFYTDLIPFIANEIQPTEFRKDTSSIGKTLKINLVYK